MEDQWWHFLVLYVTKRSHLNQILTVPQFKEFFPQVPDHAQYDLQQTLSLIRWGMLIPIPQLTLKRLVFSNCQMTGHCLWILSHSSCFQEASPHSTKTLTGIVSESEWKFFLLLPLSVFPNVPPWAVLEWKKAAGVAGKPHPTPWAASAAAVSRPKGTSSRLTLPGSAQLGSPELCPQTKPLLCTPTQLRSGGRWHTLCDSRTLGLTNGKTNQAPMTPSEELAAKLQTPQRTGKEVPTMSHEHTP